MSLELAATSSLGEATSAPRFVRCDDEKLRQEMESSLGSQMEPPEQWKEACCLGYIGDHPTQLYGDYDKPLRSPLTNQDFIYK